MIKHVVSISGGKDSTATLQLALFKCGHEHVIPIFCDTGNEHETVYEYLDYLEKALDIKIHRLKADFTEQIARKRMFIARDMRHGRKNGRRIRWSNKAKRRALSVLYPTGNPFLDLCLWKGRFPSRKAQFCTEELKRNMAVSFQLDLIDAGHQIISWQGVRRDESINRRNAKKFERVGHGLWIFRPIVDWSAADVFDYCREWAIAPNPLYKQGMSRVGCMPCINVNKAELAEISRRFPEHLERISEWEILVSKASKRGFSTFMHKGPVETSLGTEQKTYEAGNIQQVVRWAKTSRGGRQMDLLEELIPSEECKSSYGLCDQFEVAV